jgi:hypothetical protein
MIDSLSGSDRSRRLNPDPAMPPAVDSAALSCFTGADASAGAGERLAKRVKDTWASKALPILPPFRATSSCRKTTVLNVSKDSHDWNSRGFLNAAGYAGQESDLKFVLGRRDVCVRAFYSKQNKKKLLRTNINKNNPAIII